MIKVAIVILNWNGKTFLERFLPAVMEYSPGYAQVFVADNGSSDGSLEFVAQNFPGVNIIDLGKNHGYTGGYNLSLKQIDAQYYVLLNSDIQVTSRWVEPIVELMDAHTNIAACQPKILAYNQPDHFEYAGASGGFMDYLGYPFCRGRIFQHVEKDQGQYDDTIDVFWATGACMFVRAEDFWKAGSLDTTFFAHMEEIDLCWRLKRMGKRILCCPESRVYHVGGGTLPKNNSRKTYLNFRNNLFLLAKNLPARTFYPVVFKRLIMDQMAAAKFLFSGQIRDFLAVYKAGFSVLKSFRKKRKEGKWLPYLNVIPVYKKSIVIEHYVRGKNKFTELTPQAFK